MLKGIVASEGIGIGKAFIVESLNNDIIKERNISEKEIDSELDKLQHAVKSVKNELIFLKERAEKEFSQEAKNILSAQVMILEDPLFIGEVIDLIKVEKLDAISSYARVMNKFIELFKKMKEEYFRDRAEDIKDVGERVIDALKGKFHAGILHSDEEIVLVGKQVGISDLLKFDKGKISGICIESSGRTSHIAIFSKTLEIPMIVGLKDISAKVTHGQDLILDGISGEVFINFDKEQLGKYENIREDYYIKRFEEKENNINIESRTKDGKEIIINANIESNEEATTAHEYGAHSIGLYRTEFIFAECKSLPSEEYQYQIYMKILNSYPDKWVNIRTFDLGGDKQFFKFKSIKEDNPFLGLRGIRISLRYKNLFKTQLRALLRASIYGKLQILFPMISSYEEIVEIKKIVNLVKKELRSKDFQYSDDIRLGVLIETPASSFMIDDFSKEVDFFSIGTNDLLQFTIAVDRNNSFISDCYNPFHPVIFRSLKKIIDRVHKNGKTVSVCGEMASNPLIMPILLGLGVDNISVSPPSIPRLKNIVRSIDINEVKKIAEKILTMSVADDIKNYLNKNFKKSEIAKGIK